MNRISLGVQSFNEGYLKKLERLCGPESVYRAAQLLKDFGFENFNLDLIMGISGQSVSEVLEDLKKMTEIRPKHLSSYNLSLKPGHPLYKDLPGEDLSADIYEAACEYLEAAGYKQYEISNFSLPGFECKHNLLYWTGGDFLGVGPSAAGRFFFEGVFHHKKNLSEFKMYLEKALESVQNYESTTAKQTLLEATFLELRCNAGVDVEEFRKRYGKNLTESSHFEMLKKHEMLKLENGRLLLTKKGRLLADSVTPRLVE